MALTVQLLQLPSLDIPFTGGQFLGLPVGAQVGKTSAQFSHNQDFSLLSAGTPFHGLSLFHQGPRTQALETESPLHDPNLAPHPVLGAGDPAVVVMVLGLRNLFRGSRRQGPSPSQSAREVSRKLSSIRKEVSKIRKLQKEFQGQGIDTDSFDERIRTLEAEEKGLEGKLRSLDVRLTKEKLTQARRLRGELADMGAGTEKLDRQIEAWEAEIRKIEGPLKIKAKPAKKSFWARLFWGGGLHPDARRAIEGDHDDPIPRPATRPAPLKPVAAPAVQRPKAAPAVARPDLETSVWQAHLEKLNKGETVRIEIATGRFELGLMPDKKTFVLRPINGANDPQKGILYRDGFFGNGSRELDPREWAILKANDVAMSNGQFRRFSPRRGFESASDFKLKNKYEKKLPIVPVNRTPAQWRPGDLTEEAQDYLEGLRAKGFEPGIVLGHFRGRAETRLRGPREIDDIVESLHHPLPPLEAAPKTYEIGRKHAVLAASEDFGYSIGRHPEATKESGIFIIREVEGVEESYRVPAEGRAKLEPGDQIVFSGGVSYLFEPGSAGAAGRLTFTGIKGIPANPIDLPDEALVDSAIRVRDSEFQVDSLLPPLAHNFFGGGDPREVQVEKSVREENRPILDAAGQKVGKASICAGGQDGSVTMTCPDGTLLSAATSAAGRDHQEDSYYASWFELPDGTVAKIVALVDGAGGMGGGDVASSAFAQGIHAAVIEAAKASRVPLAGELWREGNLAVLHQGKLANAKKATGAATIFVIAGDKATIASAADATGIHLRRPAPGSGYQAIGYTEVDHVKIGIAKFITNGIHENNPRLFFVQIQEGDGFGGGSDGLLENTIGNGYKDQGSSEMRKLLKIPPPTQETFEPLNLIMGATSGQPDAARSFHDVALSNIKNPGQVFSLGGTEIQLPSDPDEDNIVAVVIQIGDVTPSTAVSIPPEYGPMPAVGDDSAPVAPPAAVPPPLPPAPPARHSGPPEIESVAVKGTQRVRTIYLNGLYTLRLVLGPVWSAAGAFELTPGAKNPKNPITADLILGTRILGRRELVSVQRKNGGFHVENRSSEPIEARGLNGPIVIPPGTSLDAPDGTGLIVRGTPVILRSHRR